MPAPFGDTTGGVRTRTHRELVPDRKEPYDLEGALLMPALVHADSPQPERLLTVAQAAALLGTTERFPRRLIEERRIRFTRIGRHVRIPESALRAFIEAGTVEPLVP